ncbi:hypothetical protein FB446DRAFT_699198 [Lentinula raphanica]|nr:hypothetical protein C8R42DRAFT_716989 [Lentinula raphanica]KAJ3778492.1 hypothetical protein FB446DRAFT_699198 [Lentinula raphanica]
MRLTIAHLLLAGLAVAYARPLPPTDSSDGFPVSRVDLQSPARIEKPAQPKKQVRIAGHMDLFICLTIEGASELPAANRASDGDPPSFDIETVTKRFEEWAWKHFKKHASVYFITQPKTGDNIHCGDVYQLKNQKAELTFNYQIGEDFFLDSRLDAIR